MITDHCQRQTVRRTSYRPAGEVIRTRDYEVAAISGDVARAFVELHHYAGTCSPTAHPFGLFRCRERDMVQEVEGLRAAGDERAITLAAALPRELAGVAVFGPPPSMNAHRAVFPSLETDEAVTLGRFVLVDDVPGNGESWFLARCFELLATKGIAGVECCSDPEARATDDGRIVHKGHIGTIYCATNGRYIGKTNPATLRLLPDGTVLSNRASGKLARGERGDTHPVSQLVAAGATSPIAGEDLLAWLRLWRGRLTRGLRHHGNHRYVWCLDKRRRREVLAAPSLPYPKVQPTLGM